MPGSGGHYPQGVAKKVSKKKTRKKVARKGRGMDAPAVADPDLTHPPPMAFEDILGHAAAKDVLTASIASGRVHHAWIFHGPKGVGKFATALSFAAHLLDPQLGTDLTGRPIVDPSTPIQNLLAAGTHPDLHIVRKELARYSENASVRDSKQTTIAKDVVENHLIKPAGLRPSHPPGGAASKVFIVDEAELLDSSPTNAPSQNALLKTLEEPPEGTVIILVTSNEERLLPTIRSRSQRVGFTSLDDDSMRDWASRALPDLDSQALGWLLGFAEGSPGAAVEAHASGLHEWHETLSPMLDGAWRGNAPVDLGVIMAGFAESWAETFVKNHAGASKANANRDGAGNVLRLVGRDARRRLSRAAMEGSEPGMERAAAQMRAVVDAEHRLGSNVSLKLVMAGLAEDLVSPRSL